MHNLPLQIDTQKLTVHKKMYTFAITVYTNFYEGTLFKWVSGETESKYLVKLRVLNEECVKNLSERKSYRPFYHDDLYCVT